MKFVTKAVLSFATAVLAFQATPAMAWGAVASYDGRIVYLAVNEKTADAAKEAAVEGCKKFYGKTCDWVSKPVTATALVVSKPIRSQGIYFSADPNPQVAAENALRMCRVDHSECGIITAAWDSGPTWWGKADGKNYNYVYLNADTEDEAKNEALDGCENGVEEKGSCKVSGFGSGSGWAATAEKDNQFWRGYGATKAEATKDAMKNCGDTACKVTGSGENKGSVPEPAGMKKVREMQRQSIAKWKKMGNWIE